MAGGMTVPRKNLKRLFGAACAVLAVPCGYARAEALPDPTRPPAALEAPVAPSAATTPPAGVGLQTIIRRAGRKPAAVINGEYVELGAKVGEAKLVQIGDDSVILQGPAGKEVLKLTPNVGKEAPMAAKKTGGAGTAPQQKKTGAEK